MTDVLNILNRGEYNRHYAETKLNHHSSRSHTVFRVFVESVTKDFESTSMPRHVMHSMLSFVDLAGSEKLSSHFTPKGEFNQNE
jgi:hypothetical protein